MSADPERISGPYSAALAAYVVGGGEELLSRAYELGREALGGQLGILDVAAIHAQALEIVVSAADPTARRAIEQTAGDFFRELLSPFEMALRGYRDANRELQRLNETLVQQKDALELANQELESFSYSVSHDLRAPLRGIDGFSQALLEDYGEGLDAQAQKYLRYVRESAQQMAQLIDDLLSLARVTRSELRRAPVDLTALARHVVDRLRLLEPERQVELVLAEGVAAVGDDRLLALALQNLLGNAWKFTRNCTQARIEVGQRQENGRTVYFVRDNGAGFDMSHAARLFGVFQRLHAATEFEGTGVGLAIVQRIVRRHGGQVWAEGRVGTGATFSFTLGE